MRILRRNLLPVLSSVVIAVIFFACAPVYKANVDYAMSGDILWPGKPEKPRIKYLWNIYSLSPDISVLDFVAGGGDVSDPRSSLTLLRPNSPFFENDRLYITDPGAMRATLVNIKTMDVLQVGVSGKGELDYPIGLIVDKAGNIYISDSALGKVFVYDREGNFIRNFSDIDFQRPTGMAYDRQRDIIYVVDTLGHKIYGIGIDGKLKVSYGGRGEGDGEFNYPTYITVDREGRVYVSDTLNFRVQCFDSEGKYILKFGKLGDVYERFKMPKGIATDTEGNVYVVDTGQDMVKIFDRKGKFLLFFGQPGSDRGMFSGPSGIFIDKDDKIYVADTFNQRVQVFQFLGGK